MRMRMRKDIKSSSSRSNSNSSSSSSRGWKGWMERVRRRDACVGEHLLWVPQSRLAWALGNIIYVEESR
ncbi:hypothetical protein M0802_005608 [Mischocyttarus mexicanus]|nr:hypothetical protein M0802_005608 [Mischocyttarus mexicanus]